MTLNVNTSAMNYKKHTHLLMAQNSRKDTYRVISRIWKMFDLREWFLLKLHISGKKNSPLWRMSILRFITLSHIGLDMFSNNFLNNSYVYFIWQFLRNYCDIN